MRVRGDRKPYTSLAGHPRIDVVEVEPVGLTVDFQRDAVAGGGGHHGVHRDAVRVALQKQAAGWMAENVDPSALERLEEAVGHLRLVLAEMRMDGGDDDIE